jgi:hypothetical protein
MNCRQKHNRVNKVVGGKYFLCAFVLEYLNLSIMGIEFTNRNQMQDIFSGGMAEAPIGMAEASGGLKRLHPCFILENTNKYNNKVRIN